MNDILNQISIEYGTRTLHKTKKYLYITNKLVKCKTRLIFLEKCKKEKITPRFISDKGKIFKSIETQNQKINNHYLHKKISNMKKTLFSKFLNVEIKISKNHNRNLNIDKFNFLNFLESNLHINIFHKLLEMQEVQINIAYNKHKANLIKKFERLKVKQYKKPELHYDKSNLVNLTDYIIPEECVITLSMGPKFSFPTRTKEIPIIDILSETENILFQYKDSEQRNEDRTTITNVISQYLTKNETFSDVDILLTKSKHLTNKFFKENNELILTNSDKSKKTVIMEKVEYEEKMNDLLSDNNTYVLLNKDPTNMVLKKCIEVINELYNNSIISNRISESLKIKHPISPKIYGLPKLHKTGIPLRPIVSTIDSPAYNISKFCCNILKQLTVNSEYNVKNSYEFKKHIDNIILNDNDILVSFDVVSLFTNIPVNIAKEIIIEQWPDIENKTDIDLEYFLKLFDIAIVHNNYFQFNDKFYKQKNGLAMGNPLSPILADIVMDKLFNTIIPRLKNKPTFIYKYVDDIILAIPEIYINELKNLMESFCQQIIFTVEKECNNKINFLDITLIRNINNNKITTNWYKKELTSDRMINFMSTHPFKMKRNIAVSFINRVFKLSDPSFRNSNISLIKSILTKNGYPLHLINKWLINTIYKTNNNNNKKPDTIENDIEPTTSNPMIFGSLTYIKGLTENIQKSFKIKNQKKRIANKITNKGSNIYTKLKDPIKKEQKTNVVYEIPCECGQAYIGETLQSLGKRLKQHQSGRENSALTKHSSSNHKFKFENTKIIDKEKHFHKRKFKEACHIWLKPNVVNFKTDTQGLHSNYTKLINKYRKIKRKINH